MCFSIGLRRLVISCGNAVRGGQLGGRIWRGQTVFCFSWYPAIFFEPLFPLRKRNSSSSDLRPSRKRKGSGASASRLALLGDFSRSMARVGPEICVLLTVLESWRVVLGSSVRDGWGMEEINNRKDIRQLFLGVRRVETYVT